MYQLSSSNRLTVGMFARGAEYRKYCLWPDNVIDFYHIPQRQKITSES